jgi:DNA repair protein RadC
MEILDTQEAPARPAERPREKLILRGAEALADQELLAIMLGSGQRGQNVNTLARRLLQVLDERNGTLQARDLLNIYGIGSAKATLVLAALEFARRRIRPKGVKIRSAQDVLPLLNHFTERKQEHFLSISLNGAHELIATRVVTVGLVNQTQVHPREVFSDLITDRACALIVAHNHPSGDLEPSTSDVAVTKRLKEAGEILGLRLLDHIIFGERGYYSFQEAGRL